VAKSLSNICSKSWVPKVPSLKKLPTVQHLHTVIHGHLRRDGNIWSAAQALWPTSAVGGVPKERAIAWITEFEGRDRGWYSGLVGCVSASGQNGTFLVSIRSGILHGKRAFLFAGSGIVPQSDPEKEFEETLWKMEPMMRALTRVANTSK
jgi:isochorismate synthase EntC